MKLLTPVQALTLVTLLGCVKNCCAAAGRGEVCREKEVEKPRKFLIVQTVDPATNKTINTFNDSSMQHLKSDVTRLLIPYFFLAVFIVGLPANGLALWVLVTRIKQLPSTFLLINLALADLLVLLSLPWRIAYHLLGNNWVFGEALCRISTALLYGNIYGSILFLTCIGADRYLAIVHPFISKATRSKTAVCCICGGVWLVLVLSMVPHYITKQSYWIDTLNITLCNDAFPIQTLEHYRPYLICQVLFGFMIPCLIVVFCYISIISTLATNDMKYGHVIMATLLVLLVFLVCLTPFNVTLLVQIYTQSSDVYYYTMICLAVSTLSNCIDPFIYYYISEEFRNKLTGLFTAYRTETGSGKSDQSLVQSSNQPRPNPPQSV